MKKWVFSVLMLLNTTISFANHIVGGEMVYIYDGPGALPNTKNYTITLKLFRDQHTTGAIMPTEVYIGVYNNDNDLELSGYDPIIVQKDDEGVVRINPFPPCLTGAPDLDYHVATYTFQITLPDNVRGYTATYQTCCRVNPLRNVFNSNGGSGTGSTYSCTIPPVSDNSPEFSTALNLICAKRQFQLDFSAKDADGDSLEYNFASALNGGPATNATNINPAPPPYASVKYINGFSPQNPLGNKVTINSATGIISGIAPAAGEYIVGVRVSSYRNGILLNDHLKDFIINVGNCDFAGAQLEPKPVTCDGFSVTFSNSNNSPLNQTYTWDFGDPKSGELNFSTDLAPTHVYSDTGMYSYKLVVNKGQACADSSSQTVQVYPGFFPGFSTSGQCKQFPVEFIDTTISKYAPVSYWSWDFGDLNASNDTSHADKPRYTFPNAGDYQVTFIVGNNKGCIDTVQTTITIKDKPDFSISNDTLICVIDTLQLHTFGNGTTVWTPNYNISNQNTQNPLVSPDIPTKYFASYKDEFGCPGKDSVFVDVKKFVTIKAGKDTGICRSDPIQLTVVSDALSYSWSPPATLNSDTSRAPVAKPLATTTYTVIGNIGKCQASDAVTVSVAPYPAANAGNDSTICAGGIVQLHATGGSSYIWSPALYLNDPTISDPVGTPPITITYTVTVRDTIGCPKPAQDSVTVIVQKVLADAGPRDTSIVLRQPLQLNATGGDGYLWSPSAGLTNPNIPNPVAHLSNNQEYVVKVTTSAGCSATDSINVTVYKIDPGVYVPNAFTPNNDGLNDQFHAIAIGMKSIKYFRIFNRWGQLLFSTKETKKGWDGTYSGKPQDPAIYVWVVEGTDYLDQKVAQKGTVVLIR
ncbi:MAG: PKD domain-containing protein [Ginsengibacter sp.]